MFVYYSCVYYRVLWTRASTTFFHQGPFMKSRIYPGPPHVCGLEKIDMAYFLHLTHRIVGPSQERIPIKLKTEIGKYWKYEIQCRNTVDSAEKNIILQQKMWNIVPKKCSTEKIWNIEDLKNNNIEENEHENVNTVQKIIKYGAKQM